MWRVLVCVAIAGAVSARADDGVGGAPAATAQATPAVVPLNYQLLELKTQREELAGSAGAGDARVRDLDARIDAIRVRMGVALRDGAATTAMPAAVPVFPRIVPMEAGAVGVGAGASVTNGVAGRFQDETAEEYGVRIKLEQTLVSLKAEAQPLEKVLATWNEQAGVNLSVNWPAFTLAGVDRNTPVTLNVSGVTAERCLKLVLDQIGGTQPMGHTVVEGVVHASTLEDLSSVKFQKVVVYDVRDLLLVPTTGSLELATQMRYAQSASVMDAIRASVARDTWCDGENPSGTIGSMREFNGMLIVNQTNENQHVIQQFLAALRASRRR